MKVFAGRYVRQQEVGVLGGAIARMFAISLCDRPFDLFFRFGAPPSDAGCDKGDRATQQKGECKSFKCTKLGT
jgi:hypothetical protein